ncbi:MAG: hypothetical protein QM535_14290 [Limnohabitans sp.]|nr:hypothetical protein [Limnohabitans sp.]
MKNAALLILLLPFLLQSCYSYKTINLGKTDLVEGKKYKVMQDNKLKKVSLVTTNDSIATFKNGKVQNQIPISELKDIKIRKFSVIKTIALIPMIYAIGTSVYLLSSLSNINKAGN